MIDTQILPLTWSSYHSQTFAFKLLGALKNEPQCLFIGVLEVFRVNSSQSLRIENVKVDEIMSER